MNNTIVLVWFLLTLYVAVVFTIAMWVSVFNEILWYLTRKEHPIRVPTKAYENLEGYIRRKLKEEDVKCKSFRYNTFTGKLYINKWFAR